MDFGEFMLLLLCIIVIVPALLGAALLGLYSLSRCVRAGARGE
jgi:hypothetical protein